MAVSLGVGLGFGFMRELENQKWSSAVPMSSREALDALCRPATAVMLLSEQPSPSIAESMLNDYRTHVLV